MSYPAVRPHPGSLRWNEVIRCREVEDTSDAYAIALAVLREDTCSPEELEGQILRRISANSPDSLENQIDLRLIDHFGSWASGWRWAKDEGSLGGGPISAWCCPTHSMTTPDETALRVRSALDEWRDWILRLDRRFQELAVPPQAADHERRFQHAAARLVHDVVVQTNAGDAWYGHCAQVLGWYLECHGFAPTDADGMVDRALSGRFLSWIGPDDATVSEVTASLANAAAQQHERRG